MSQGTQQDWDNFVENIESWDAVGKLLIALSKEVEKDLTWWREMIAVDRDQMNGLIDVFRVEAE